MYNAAALDGVCLTLHLVCRSVSYIYSLKHLPQLIFMTAEEKEDGNAGKRRKEIFQQPSKWRMWRLELTDVNKSLSSAGMLLKCNVIVLLNTIKQMCIFA